MSQRNVPSSVPPPARGNHASPPGDDGSVPTVDLSTNDLASTGENAEYERSRRRRPRSTRPRWSRPRPRRGCARASCSRPPCPTRCPSPAWCPAHASRASPRWPTRSSRRRWDRGARRSRPRRPPSTTTRRRRRCLCPRRCRRHRPSPPFPLRSERPPARTSCFAPSCPAQLRAAAAHVVRSRAYAFVLDARGMPIEMGCGRFAKAYLAEERWLESKTDFRRPVVIKILQKGVDDEDRLRFQMEKELLERVQGHPNIVGLCCLGRERRSRVRARLHPRQGRERLRHPRAPRHVARGAPEGRTRAQQARGPALVRSARAAVPGARLHDPGRQRDRVRAPGAERLPPRHQAGQRPGGPARSEPARRHARGAPGRLQRRQAPRRRREHGHDATSAACPGRCSSRAPSRRPTSSSCSSTWCRAAPRSSSSRTSTSRSRRTTPSRSTTAATSTPCSTPIARKKRIVLDRPYRDGERGQRPRQDPEERRPAGRHLLAGRALLLPGERRLREPEDALRRLPQVHRVRVAPTRPTPSTRTWPTSTASSRACAPPSNPARARRRWRRPTASSRTSTTSTATAISSSRTS